MKKSNLVKCIFLALSLVMILSLFLVGCGKKEEADNATNLTSSNWVYVKGEDQGAITFTDGKVTAVFVFEGQANASMIQGTYEVTDTTFTVDDPNTGNQVAFTYTIEGDTLTISQINGTAVDFQYTRK